MAPKNGEFEISIRHFGATWRHKFAKMAPLWRHNGAIVAIQRTRHFMAPRGAKCSPRGATVAPRSAILAPLWRHVAPQSAHDLKYYTTNYSLHLSFYDFSCGPGGILSVRVVTLPKTTILFVHVFYNTSTETHCIRGLLRVSDRNSNGL